jgi:hypothetical protein
MRPPSRGAPKFADRAARPVRPEHREDVGVEGRGAVAAAYGSACCERGGCESREREETEDERALQWCSMTRSTRLYSFASSALMK